MSAVERAAAELIAQSAGWRRGTAGHTPERHIAKTLADAGLLVTDEMRAVFDTHHRITESLLDYDCYAGNCECDECVEHPVDVCAECLSFAWDINDEYVPHRALAEHCPILVASEALATRVPS